MLWPCCWCELVAGLLTNLFTCLCVFCFGSLDSNQITDVGAGKIAEVMPSTKLTSLR